MDKPTAKYLDDTDDIINELSSLKGMFGAVIHPVNPSGMIQKHPLDDFEDWFRDIRDRLERIIEKVSGGFDEEEIGALACLDNRAKAPEADLNRSGDEANISQ